MSAPSPFDSTHPLQAPEEHSVDTEHVASSSGAAPKRTVVIAVDPSEHAANAVEWARHNFLRPTDRVVLVHVRPYQQIYMGDLAADLLSAVSSLEASARQSSHDLIRSYARTIMSAPGPNDDAVVPLAIEGFAIRGDARQDIVRKAQELKAAGVVMGSRGLGAVKRALLGSVSDYVVNHAGCPVVVVRPENTA
ncbi:hypothetical protein BC828DRAFT_347459 [Blastocladiella britannica]|nr:hypothetical protein BC828DRAFT_347459 [Blastocladiella britannica]